MKDRPSLFVLGSFVVACSARVELFPKRGESAIAEHFLVEAGGKGFNVAAGAHKLGANVYSIFAIGNDVFAQIAERAFTKAGFVPTRVRRCESRTGSGIGFIDATGETCVAVYPGANAELAAEDVHAVAAEVADAQVVLAQFEILDAPIAAAFARARRNGVTTILNPSPFRMPTADILRDTSILVVNEVEFMALARALGETATFAGSGLPQAIVDSVLARGPDVLIVTRGARGALAYRRHAAACLQPGFAVEAVDCLGAGDAFLAAFAVGLAEALPFEIALRQAAAAGALATLRPGVFDALATPDALRSFLAERDQEAHLSIDGL